MTDQDKQKLAELARAYLDATDVYRSATDGQDVLDAIAKHDAAGESLALAMMGFKLSHIIVDGTMLGQHRLGFIDTSTDFVILDQPARSQPHGQP